MIITFCTNKTTTPEEKLLPPTNLTISLVENNKIQLTWVDNSTNETKFLIDRKRGEYNWFGSYGDVSANIVSFNDNISTTSDTIYSYSVRAFNEEEYSAYTDTVAWISENAKPSNLEIIQIVQDSLKLTWQDNSIGEQYFRIDRKIDNLNWTENYAKVDGNLTEFIDNNTALFDTCYYKIFAVSGISDSDYSENSFVPFLPAPSNLDLQAHGATEVTLTWQDNCHNEEGYRLYIKRGETALWDSLDLPENTQDYNDENVTPGVVNYYEVCAYHENDTSGYINDEINTLPAPSNLNCTQQNVHTFELNWNDNSQFEQGFKIDRKIDNSEWTSPLAVTAEDMTTFTDSTIGRNYNTVYYRLSAYYEIYNSDTLETNSAITFQAPTNLQYEKLDIHTIKLTWENNSQGEDGYIVDKKVGTEDWTANYATLAENAEEWTDNNSEINENLTYRIYAYCGTNNSDYAETQNISTEFTAPMNFTYLIIGQSEIKLLWNYSLEGINGFVVERRVLDGDWNVIANVDETIHEFIDDELNQNEIYFYRVYAFYNDIHSTYSEEVAYSESYIMVPGQYSTIQAAINHSFAGNNILVLPNTYYENIDFNGKNVNIASLYFITQDTSYISKTIIDANQNDGVVNFRSGENSTAVLNGFTVQNGSAYYGGGISYNDSNASLKNLIIKNNSADYGGGISCEDGAYPNLENVVIISNSASLGGGIYFESGSLPIFEDVVICNNHASRGGGIYCENWHNIIIENIEINNNSSNDGGGIFIRNGSDLNFQDINIINNAADHGGGIYCQSGSEMEFNNVGIMNNSASRGGGIYFEGGTSIIKNTTIVGNTADYGGGIEISWCYSINIENVTISDNTSNIDGGAIYQTDGNNTLLLNCILWNNTPNEISMTGGSIDITYSDLQVAAPGIGNIISDPHFINPQNWDYHLQLGSPCIDAGNPSSQYNDPDGSRNDMGAFGGSGGDW